ncbi:disease resistance protein RPS2-like [Eucalyptus grandis]|uniref:disease resistance protein RPS2-like n=1 Tax=Eucalyptus grandis TaxID=71139 RepID=UPI00192E8093|nr:disease resistance protein RPS2-like [Eucalyptus grandis]
MTDIVLSVASKVAEYLVALRRHSSYVMFSGSYTGQLKEELEKLENARQRVQLSIDEAQQEMKLIKAHPEKWVIEVKNVVDMAQNALKHDERAKKTFFFGWLPNLKERYRLGREVTRTVRDIQASIRQGQLEMVYCRHAPSRHVVGALDVNSSADHWGDTAIESRASILEKIMNDLDDEKLKVIVIYGQDGVGKTNLLEEVEKKLRSEKRLFDVIAKVKVSQTLKNIQDAKVRLSQTLKNIQDGIAYAFSLNLKDELSEERRRGRLFGEIQSDSTKKVLIILEDLGAPLDLEKVGIPSGNESRGCKLLLTSRFENVLAKDKHADRTIHLEDLHDDEAFRLFEKIVRDRLKNEKLKSTAAKVVKKLAGLPLLITSVASTLKYSNIFVWRNVLRKIGESNIDAIVKFCYDNLKSEDAKSLFILCGLIGGTIQVDTLLVLGMGLGLFEGSFKRIEGSREKLKTSLDSLRSVCLLLDGGDDKENVTIHDLYSEVVVSTPLRGENSLVMNINYHSWSTEKLVECWAIYLVDVVDGRLAEVMSCRFTDLKILMLSQLEDGLGRPAHRHDERDCCRLDFTYMKDLQVLYLRSMHITTLPSSIENLKNLLSLFLDNCLVEDVAILGKLKALQFLSFAGSSISRLPKEMGELKKLRLLNLSDCKKLHIIEPDVLNGLVNLEELYMKGSFDRWVGPDEIPSKSCNAGPAELRSLTKLTTLEISVLDATIIVKNDSIKKK